MNELEKLYDNIENIINKNLEYGFTEKATISDEGMRLIFTALHQLCRECPKEKKEERESTKAS